MVNSINDNLKNIEWNEIDSYLLWLSNIVSIQIWIEADIVKWKIQELISLWKTEIDIMESFWIHVEEVELWYIHWITLDDISELNNENKWMIEHTQEEQLFIKELEKIDFSKFKEVKEIKELNVGDMVDFDIKWFLRFVIVKIKGTTNKNWKIYATCIINGIKLINIKWKQVKKFFVNKEYIIELPLISKWEIVITDNTYSNLIVLKIIWMKFLSWETNWLKKLFNKFLKKNVFFYWKI